MKKNNKIALTALAVCAIVSTPSTFAQCKTCRHHHKHHVTNQDTAQAASTETLYKDYKDMMPAYHFVPNWYVGGHIGESRTHDSAAPGSGDSVTQIGPGWTVDVGYQFLQVFQTTLAAELGYTQYHNSNETLTGVNVASTEHFATYLAAVAQYPLKYNFGLLGKLGVAYSYAKKVFTATGVSASANDYSPYYGAGITYNVTQNASFVLQWARARGNSKTGSTDLTSFGISYNFL